MARRGKRLAARLAVLVFAILYAFSIVVTFVKVERHLSSGGRPFHLEGPPAVARLTSRRNEKRNGGADASAGDEESSRSQQQRRHYNQSSSVVVPQVEGLPSVSLSVGEKSSAEDQQRRRRPGRFPLRGTSAFSEECGWTVSPPIDPVFQNGSGKGNSNCTVLVRPGEGGNEGVSCWSMQVVNGYLQARQSGCRLLIDYGAGVDVRRVMEPLMIADSGRDAVGTGDEEGLYDWSVPGGSDFECSEERRCYVLGTKAIMERARIDGRVLVGAPNYRMAYGNKPDRTTGKCKGCLHSDSARALEKVLPGYRLNSGVACAFSNLFRPAYPAAAEFEPRLFTEILPALRDPDSLVLSIYIRTGWADDIARYEENVRKGLQNSTDKKPEEKDYRKSVAQMMQCAMNVEDGFKSKVDSGDVPPYSKIVWMVLTDSPSVKRWALDPPTLGKDVTKRFRNQYARFPNRTTLVTSSRGVHTRTRRTPSTADFAEALLDWYLIGESDAVVLNRLTFGYTASLRTSRPVYSQGNNCKEPETLVYDRPASG